MDVLTALDMLIRSADLGSFAAAARQLGVTPVAVGKQVAKLERDLGAQLVMRTTRSFALTEAGQRLVAEARGGVLAVQNALDATNQRTDGIVGTLRVSLPSAFGRRYVLPSLGPFLDRHRHLRLDWQFENRRVDLVAEGFDLGIAGGIDLAGGLVARTLVPLHLVVVASPAYLEKAGPPALRRPDELPVHALVAMRSASTGRVRPWALRSATETTIVEPDPRIVVNDPDAVREAVLAGHGIGLCGLSHVLADLDRGDLVRLLPGWWADLGRIVLYYPATRLLPAKTRAFTDFITAAFAAQRLAERLDASAMG